VSEGKSGIAQYCITMKPLQMGFMNVPKAMQPLFPKTIETVKINAVFEDSNEEKQLSFQGKYNRIFGLTAWYRRNNAGIGDIVEVEHQPDRDQYVFRLRRIEGLTEFLKPVKPAKPMLAKPLKKAVGEPINFRGLVYAPVNENGVIFLFGLVAKDLGFTIEGIQEAFPDAFGRRYTEGRGYPVDIEFKFKSSGYRQYYKDGNLCDLIVCWENDWKDCPIEVIELKSKIKQMDRYAT